MPLNIPEEGMPLWCSKCFFLVDLVLLCQASLSFSAILPISCNPFALPLHVSKEGLASSGGSTEYFRSETTAFPQKWCI